MGCKILALTYKNANDLELNCSGTWLSITVIRSTWAAVLSHGIGFCLSDHWTGSFSTSPPLPISKELNVLQRTYLPLHCFQGGSDLKHRSDFQEVLFVVLHTYIYGKSSICPEHQFSRAPFAQGNQQTNTLTYLVTPWAFAPPAWYLLLLEKQFERSPIADFMQDL